MTCWLLAAGCWLLAAGCWLLTAGCWLLAAGCWLLAAGCWLLAAGCWLLLAAGCWLLLAAGCCWLLAAGCWLLAASGCWLLAICMARCAPPLIHQTGLVIAWPAATAHHRCGPHACLRLAEGLRHNSMLEVLLLNGNELGEDGARLLMHALTINQSIKYLGLQVGPGGCGKGRRPSRKGHAEPSCAAAPC
jgi:hypothetical protein